jgi:DNA-binding NarL/FixJ family response regulator
MQESNHPPVKPKRTRRSAKRRGIVRLISTNPLALPELRRLAKGSRMRCRLHYLKMGLLTDVEDVRVPRAAVLVLDAFSTGAMTEKVVAAIRTQHPRACVIVLVNDLGDAQGFALLQLGVKGIVSQREAQSLAKAITFVAAGGVRMPRGLMARFLDSSFASSTPAAVTHRRLSQRERQVLDGVVKSRSNKEIANELHISESTVKFHLARIFRKFHVRRRAELIVQSAQELASLVH